MLVVYREAIERLSPYAEILLQLQRKDISLISGLDTFLKNETSLSLQERL